MARQPTLPYSPAVAGFTLGKEEGRKAEAKLISALKKANQHIEQLCSTVNVLDKARGGNGRKCRYEDFAIDIPTQS